MVTYQAFQLIHPPSVIGVNESLWLGKVDIPWADLLEIMQSQTPKAKNSSKPNT